MTARTIIWRLTLSLLLMTLTGLTSTAHGAAVSDPLQARIERSDVDRFWKAFDQLQRNPQSNPFEEYVATGSPGLKAFIPDERIKSAAALKELVLSEQNYYRAIRADSLNTNEYDARIRASFMALKYLYPQATFPTIYYVIGRTTSGGEGFPRGPIVIGLETFSRHPVTTAYGRPSIPMDLLPEIVAHEVVHFLQAPEPAHPTLLEEAYREGSADFIGELTSSPAVLTLNGKEVYAYGDAHRDRLWKEFLADMNGDSLDGWLYGTPLPGDRPQNLGYWAGYQIAKGYFKNAKNKRRAIGEIIRPTGGPAAILKKSGLRDR